MTRAALLALALGVAACGSAGVCVAETERTNPPVTPAPPRPAPAPETYPLDGAFVYRADPRCLEHGVGLTLPDLGRAVCLRGAAVDFLVAKVASKEIRPGAAFKACDWAWSQPASWAGCVEAAAREATPEIRFGQSPYWTRGSVGNVEQEGCMAGVAYYRWVRVSLHDLPRSYSLVPWETANAILVHLFDRRDLGDGSYVNLAKQHALAACPN